MLWRRRIQSIRRKYQKILIKSKKCDNILPVKNFGGVNMIKYNIYNLVVVFCNIGNGKIQCFICKEKRDKYVFKW